MDLANSLKMGGFIIVAGFAIAFYHRGNVIEQLEQTIAVQYEQIKQQEKAINTLKDHLASERQAVLNQNKINDQIQHKKQVAINDVRTIIKTQPCANTPIDKRALERLHESY